MNEKTLNAYRKLLEEKREELHRSFREKLAHTVEEGDGAMDEVDQASHLYNKEFWYALSDQDRKVLNLVEEAIARMDAGEYGECRHCGETIQKRRLDAVPWARHCLECQELQDRGLLEEVPVEADRSREG